VLKVARVAGDIAVEIAVGPPGFRARLVGAADVLCDPEVAVGVVLDPLVAAAAKGAGNVADNRWVADGGRVGRSFFVLGRQQQPPGPRVPGGAVDGRERVAVRVRGGQDGDPVLCIRVEVDPGQVAVALDPALVPLEEEVGAVVVAGVGSRQAVFEGEVGVLVRLGLVASVAGLAGIGSICGSPAELRTSLS
jgi:hypothetical protein